MTFIDSSIMVESFTPSLALPRWGERSEGGEAGQNPLPGARPKSFSDFGGGQGGGGGQLSHVFGKLNSSRVYLNEQSNMRWLASSVFYSCACSLKNYREVPLEILEDEQQLVTWARKAGRP